MYDIDGLMYYMKPFKVSTEDINKDGIFINILRNYPNTTIKTYCCKRKNANGDIYTFSDEIFKYLIPGLYRYCPETIEIITKWLKGYQMISDIKNQLITMNEYDIGKVIIYIKELQGGV